MANDLNQCTFIGRLGKDPEVRSFPSGDKVVNISIAVGKTWKDKESGDKKESTTWVPVSFFGKTAEIVGEYCKKGSQILVVGEFVVRKYQKDGEDRYATEIRGERMQLLGSPGGQQQGGGQQRQSGGGQQSGGQGQQRQQQKQAGGFDDDSDIPF